MPNCVGNNTGNVVLMLSDMAQRLLRNCVHPKLELHCGMANITSTGWTIEFEDFLIDKLCMANTNEFRMAGTVQTRIGLYD